jgi:hypothetical protein
VRKRENMIQTVGRVFRLRMINKEIEGIDRMTSYSGRIRVAGTPVIIRVYIYFQQSVSDSLFTL